MTRVGWILKDFLQSFILLGIVFFPFKWNLFGFHTDVIRSLFIPPIRSLAELSGTDLTLTDLSSDSKGLYILVALLLLIASGATIFAQSKFGIHGRTRIDCTVRTVASYYLALILLKYGLDKFMKTQFYLPEPNLLFTPMGKLDKDILFWSTMGSSYSYNIFMGLAEVIPAILLIIPKTRQAGAVIASGVLLNVVAINLSFDISVKLFSSFLLLIAFYIGLPTAARLFNMKSSSTDDIDISVFKQKPFQRKIALLIILLILITETLYPLATAHKWNDDRATRPYLHGAYEAVDANSVIKRIFIHRDGYLIFQDQDDNFTDVKLEIDQKEQTLHLQDYDNRTMRIPYNMQESTGMLSLKNTEKETVFKMLNWRELPLVKNNFHWTVD